MVQRIAAEAVTRAPATLVFGLLKDPLTWTAWSPMDKSGPDKPGPDEPNGVGSTRAFTKGRVNGIDRVVELVPNRRFSYVHVQGLPVRDYRGDVDLEDIRGGIRITWQATFKPKVPGTGWLMRRGLRKFLQQMVDGLASYATVRQSRQLR